MTNCSPLAGSAAHLSGIPESDGLRIVHAQLNWFASEAPNAAPDAEVTLRLPDESEFSVVANDAISEQFNDPLDIGEAAIGLVCGDQPPVQCLCPTAPGNATTDVRFFSNHAVVTDELQAYVDSGGSLNGEIFLGDIEIPGGDGNDPATAVTVIASVAIGGWSLLVVYGDPSLPLRRVYYYQGFELNSGEDRVLRPRGFLAPPNPVVDLTYLVLEGDESIRGDSVLVNGRQVEDQCNQRTNVFNSTVTTGPDGQCEEGVFGVDLDTFRVEGAIGPGDDSAEITMVIPTGDGRFTAGEQVFTDWMVLAFDHRLPDFEGLKPEKQAQPPSRSVVQPGDEISYLIIVENSGGDFADNVIVADASPAGTTYVTGSAAVDRRLVVDAPGGRNPFENGFNLSSLPDIGRIGPGDEHLVEFRVTVDANASDGDVIINVATIGADGIETIETEAVFHAVGELPDDFPDVGRPDDPEDALIRPDAGPRRDSGAACPPGHARDVTGGCVLVECPPGEEMVDGGGACVAPQEDNSCGPGQRVVDGFCVSVCGPGLEWDSYCGEGGQCRQETAPACGDGNLADSGCGCRATSGRAPFGIAALLGLLAVGFVRRRRA